MEELIKINGLCAPSYRGNKMNDIEKFEQIIDYWRQQYLEMKELAVSSQRACERLINEKMKHLSGEYEWISVEDYKPKDDQTVLLLNSNTDSDVPMLGYYFAEYDSFFSLDTPKAYPLAITHWLAIPKLDRKCDAE
jgi:hypothetical protein